MNTLREKYNKTATTQLSEKKFAEACCGCISSKSRRGCVCDYCDGTERDNVGDLKTHHRRRRHWHKTAAREGVVCTNCPAGAGCKSPNKDAPFWRWSASVTQMKNELLCPKIDIAGHLEHQLRCVEGRCVECEKRKKEVMGNCAIEHSDDPMDWMECVAKTASFTFEASLVF
jgi:hypothetical protein